MKTLELVCTFFTLSFLTLAQSVEAAFITDTLEDIGPDGAAVEVRSIGGISVFINPSDGLVMEGRTYFDSTPQAFAGPAHNATPNVPLHPGNVSGTRFISTANSSNSPIRPIDWVEPIVFDFSSPVFGFGITTLDLLENGVLATDFVTFEARDINGSLVSTHTRVGQQGKSGLDLDWLVSSNQANISQVTMLTSDMSGWGGYGLDDMILDVSPSVVPLPATVWFFFSGLGALLFAGSRVQVANRLKADV
ncbi:hypothetical protein [Halochromatium glycolicum]|uniref:hypothetical protein n=1 Tax=Halochromatium glycolicum TaxID=85075 RepID=UPI0019090A07|nr:hypothetical protein [Halochromatium glycolicum]